MTSPFLGEIRAFSFQFAPTGWLQCNGQLLPINQYTALFALLGTTYGGNGVQNFQLPDLRGRIALGVGSSYVQGQPLGEESVTVTTAQLPAHTHNINAANNGHANGTNIPGASVILGAGYSNEAGNPAANIYSNSAPNTAQVPLGMSGSSQPHENRMPSLVMNYCIAMVGIFPSRS
jgi:microcystin-dependent protein